MKWCIIVNDAPFLMEFLGKLSSSFIEDGDECMLAFDNKFAEHAKTKYFPKQVQSVSKVDWCYEHYDALRKDYDDLDWRPLYANFDRMDHWLWGYRESAKRLSQDYQFFEYVCQTERPDAILFEPPSGVAALVAHSLSLKYGIPYLGIIDSRIAERLEVRDSEYTDRRYQQTYSALRTENISKEELQFATRFLRDFLSHDRLPSYYGTGTIRFTILGYVNHYARRLQEIGKSLWRYFRARKQLHAVDFESENRLRVALRAPKTVIVRQFRIAFQKRFYSKPNLQEEFYVFPLHVQPEASTSVQAMAYSDQAAAIRNIAFTLPFPAKLYVKEHPLAVGMKPSSFYRKIQNIPNAQLIGPQESMPELIRNSQGVITLTGTVGMEAVMAGKPTYVLGNVFYEYHPLCRKPKSIDELRELIRRDRKNGVSHENLKQDNIRFIVSYLRNTIPGSVSATVADPDTNNYQQIARDLRRIAQMRKSSRR